MNAFDRHVLSHVPGAQNIQQLHPGLRPAREDDGFYVVSLWDPNNHFWLYFSNGCPQPPGHIRHEFMVVDAHKRAENLDIIAAVASHCRENCVSFGPAVNLGVPWYGASGLTYALVSVPYPYPESLHEFENEGETTYLQWLLPIWPEEAKFMREHDVEALEPIFDQKAINFVDPYRPSVIDSPYTPKGSGAD